MPSYNRLCRECGQPITMIEVLATGQWVALDEGTDRRHDCPGAPEPPEPPPPADWVESRSVGPLTFATACPWCSRRVFFHRNRARRDILLDDLVGPRFSMHHCWVAHRRRRRDAVSSLIKAQGLPDFRCHCGKYRGYKFAGVICDRCGKELEARGFLFKRLRVRRVNRPDHNSRHKIYGHVLRSRASSVDVADATDTRSRFVLPSGVTRGLRQGDILSIVGLAQKRRGRRWLFGLGLQCWDPLTRTQRTMLAAGLMRIETEARVIAIQKSNSR